MSPQHVWYLLGYSLSPSTTLSEPMTLAKSFVQFANMFIPNLPCSVCDDKVSSSADVCCVVLELSRTFDLWEGGLPSARSASDAERRRVSDLLSTAGVRCRNWWGWTSNRSSNVYVFIFILFFVHMFLYTIDILKKKENSICLSQSCFVTFETPIPC
jgi:hypothetical protein